MSGSTAEALMVPPRENEVSTPPRGALDWHSVRDPTGEATSPECGRSRFKAHQDQRSGDWHVKGYRKSCGRIACPVCRDQVALKEAVKADRRLRRGLTILHHDGASDVRRWCLILDPGPSAVSGAHYGTSHDDWWTRADDYASYRTSANEALKRARLRSWTMVFHTQDDHPEIGCPWRGHFHVIGDGALERRSLVDFGWTVRLEDPADTSPVEWLKAVLCRISSYTHRRSIQRLTYGGLAAPNAQAKHGAGGAGGADEELRCGLCDRAIPRGDWLRAIPTRDVGPSEPGTFRVDPNEWRFEAPLPPIWGRRRHKGPPA